MAPKRKSSAPAAKQEKKPKKALPEDAPDIVRDAVEESSRRPASDRKTEELKAAVAKAFRDNFKGWPTERFDEVTRNGMTLREHITKAKEEQAQGLRQVGMHFYAEMRSLFEDEDALAHRMAATDLNAPRDTRVDKAVDAFSDHRVGKEQMLGIFHDNYVPNSKSIKAMFLVSAELSPNSCSENADYYAELCRWPTIMRSPRSTRICGAPSSTTWTSPWRRPTWWPRRRACSRIPDSRPTRTTLAQSWTWSRSGVASSIRAIGPSGRTT